MSGLNRTDLAIESQELSAEDMSGVSIARSETGSIGICELVIETEAAAKRLGKPVGRYITIEAPELLYDTDVYTKTYELVAENIRRICDADGDILVAGLGNRAITPDALGPEVVSRVFVTNHIKEQLNYDFCEKLGRVSAIAPGVLGTTGMETSQIIRGVVNEQKPTLVIAVDAYAARNVSRMSTTIQISDAGMIPGGGVGNRRAAINRETLGVPVVAVGVPTVVDAAAVAGAVLGIEDEEEIRNRLGSGAPDMVVTPKEIDLVIDRAAKTIANGINLAAHPKLSIDEIESYIG